MRVLSTGPVIMSGTWEDCTGHSLVHFGGNNSTGLGAGIGSL